jgi:hypothetical protein
MPRTHRLLLAAFVLAAEAAGSLRFQGHGVAAPGLDRVKIPLQTPENMK